MSLVPSFMPSKDGKSKAALKISLSKSMNNSMDTMLISKAFPSRRKSKAFSKLKWIFAGGLSLGLHLGLIAGGCFLLVRPATLEGPSLTSFTLVAKTVVTPASPMATTHGAKKMAGKKNSPQIAAPAEVPNNVAQHLGNATAAIVYPLAARMAQEEGDVFLRLEILPSGQVGRIEVLPETTAAPRLVQAARQGFQKMQIAQAKFTHAFWIKHLVQFRLRP
jgi:TonB family protein